MITYVYIIFDKVFNNYFIIKIKICVNIKAFYS